MNFFDFEVNELKYTPEQLEKLRLIQLKHEQESKQREANLINIEYELLPDRMTRCYCCSGKVQRHQW